MKKLFITSLMALFLGAFNAAQPTTSVTLIGIAKVKNAKASVNVKIEQIQPDFEIHSLDILTFRIF